MFQSRTSKTWDQSNRDYLIGSLDQLYRSLRADQTSHSPQLNKLSDTSPELQNPEKILAGMSSPPALHQLCQTFQLSDFERNLLLLCLGLEIDSRFLDACAEAHGVVHQHYATFSWALSVLPNPHWSALAPDSPLRYWQLIHLKSGHTLTHTALHIDEKILHYLLGVQTRDQTLVGLEDMIRARHPFLPSHQPLLTKIESLWTTHASPHPMIQLCGSELEDKITLAKAVCTCLDLQLSVLSCQQLPLNSNDLTSFVRRLERECKLGAKCLVLNAQELDFTDNLLLAALKQVIEVYQGFLFLAVRSPLPSLNRPTVRIDIPKPLPSEQLMIWETSVAELKAQLHGKGKFIPEAHQISNDLKALTSQFHLTTTMIQRACMGAVGSLTTPPHSSFREALWNSCRVQARPRLDDLAERIESHLGWDDLVLPSLAKETLREMISHIQHKATVYEAWGFAEKNRRGLGVTALFSGPSGTGKTLAASVIANELNLDLYKIELSSVVSKYIGETEKNLQRIFDAAESGGVILLFDEADSIFGKRSEVKESKDRYANLEVSYLLQRMESYPGLAILTTNLQSNLDPAFLRRLRFVTQFSLPDAAHRSDIWRRVFPAATPQKDLDYDKLAQLNTPGGNIRMIALNAAFLAADEQEPVQMKHILRATQTEYEKLGKSLTNFEIAGWLGATR